VATTAVVVIDVVPVLDFDMVMALPPSLPVVVVVDRVVHEGENVTCFLEMLLPLLLLLILMVVELLVLWSLMTLQYIDDGENMDAESE
jgi:hypothetical protein